VLAGPSSVGLLRDYTTSVLIKWELDRRIDDTTLVVSELATNAAAPDVALGQPITLRLSLPHSRSVILVRVTDPSPLRPAMGHPDETDIDGRGLIIVAALAQDTGYVDEPGGGKTVWATLPTRTP